MKEPRGRAQNESYTHIYACTHTQVIIKNKSWISFYVSGNILNPGLNMANTIISKQLKV